MKITFILPSLGSGGAEHLFVLMANRLSKSYDVNIVLLGEYINSYSNILDNSVTIISINSKRIRYSGYVLLKILKQNKTNIIICALCNSYIIFLVKIFLSNVKVIITEHSNVDSYLFFNKNKYFAKVMLFMAKITYPFADALVCVSNGVLNSLHKNKIFLPRDTRVIYNGVDVDEIIKKSKNDVYTPWKTNSNIKIFIAIGRLAPVKDFYTLIYAFKIVLSKINSRLIILGEGPDKKNIQKLITNLGLQNYIYMPGFVENPYAYIAFSDVYVLSSIYEGFSNSLVQALICGKTPVVTNCDGPNEILNYGQYGYIVSNKNIDELAIFMVYATENPIDSNILKLRAQTFSIERCVDSYENLIKDIFK